MERVEASTPPVPAVVVRKADKSYKSGESVLNGLDLTVPCGSIYGLLGSSGCGKTTLLSCIVGIQKLDRGQIWIFGEEPGTKSIGIPGRNVGYMPQDMSLYSEFSIRETLNYFGTLGGMTKVEIGCRAKSLGYLLNLPNDSSRVGTLSAGQQRRVSLVVALLGLPDLLILDEPTVGVDPLIRQDIWRHLKDLVKSHRTTVIITTHYIEECRSADNVGVMRNGKLLVEGSPSELMVEHGTNNLGKIILNLSRLDIPSVALQEDDSCQPSSDCEAAATPSNMAKVLKGPSSSKSQNGFTRIRALTGKNFVVLLRNPLIKMARLLFLVTLIVPALLVLIFVALSHDPRQLSLGVINEEEMNYDFSCSANESSWNAGECTLEMWSCRYLSSIKRDVLNLVNFDNKYNAEAAVRSASIWGFITIPPNFTALLYERSSFGGLKDEFPLNCSRISVRLDESSKQISITIKLALYQAYADFIKNLLIDCERDTRLGEYALKYHTPIFGKEEMDFSEFVAPAAALAFLFFFPIVTTSVRFIKEKKSGVLLRSIVGGVKPWELLISYSISEFCVLLIQSLLSYAVITQMFHMEVIGSSALVLCLFLLSGYGGVSMGFFLGTICTEEIQAAIMAIAAFFPNLLLCGLVWPVEGMPLPLQYIVQVFPCTLAAESVRSIISRGWEFSHPSVRPGFAVLVGYIAGYFSLTVLFHKLFKR